MALEDHPAVKWGGIFIGIILPVWLACGSLYFFLNKNEERDLLWFDEDRAWNATLIQGQEDIQQRQNEIVEELATQTLRLAELEAENKLILEAVMRMSADVAFSLGKHEGRHDAELTGRD